MLIKAPWVTLAVIVTLGLGIGANSVIFSAVNAVRIRPLPYPDANRLLVIQYAPLEFNSTNPDELITWKDRLHSAGSVSAFSFSPSSVNLVDSQGAVRAAVCAVTSDFFNTLQASPALGRNIQHGDMAPGNPQVNTPIAGAPGFDQVR